MSAQPKEEEGMVGVLAPLVADPQPPEAVQPAEGALDLPSVAAEPLDSTPLRAIRALTRRWRRRCSAATDRYEET